MSFDEFKKRYEKHLVVKEAMPPDDKLAEIFIGLVVFTEWQHEEIEKEQIKQVKRTHGDLLDRIKKEIDKNV